MAKKKSKKRSKGTPAEPRTGKAPSAKLLRELAKVDELTAAEEWSAAQERLLALEARYPQRTEIFYELINVAFELDDMALYQKYCERYHELVPNDLVALQGLSGAYLENHFPWLALASFQNLLERQPEHELAESIRTQIGQLESLLEKTSNEFSLPSENAMKILVLNDRIRALLDYGEPAQARKAALELLTIAPDFVPALNNLSQIEVKLDQPARALELAEAVLVQQPNNVQALGNSTRIYMLLGDVEKAHATADRLLLIQADEDEIWLKQAEALSFLGRNDDMLALAAAAQAKAYLDSEFAHPLFFHFHAVAAARTGDERTAKRAWQAALQRDPNFRLAAENLEDLNKPQGEREGAWAHTVNEWLSVAVNQDFKQMVTASAGNSTQTVKRAVRRFVRRHPHLRRLIPIFFERGDPYLRSMASFVALYADEAELHAALRDFVTSPYGTDEARANLANMAKKSGILSSGVLSMWVQGERQDVVSVEFEIHEEPLSRLPESVDDLYSFAMEALYDDKLEDAEALLLEAMELEPNRPEILNNLALTYLRQARDAEADALLERITSEFPDYLFGIVARANQARLDGNFEEAFALLDPLLSRSKLHISEFRAVCSAFVHLQLAQKSPQAAEAWLDMWEAIEPDSPDLMKLRLQVKFSQSPLAKLPTWGRKKR